MASGVFGETRCSHMKIKGMGENVRGVFVEGAELVQLGQILPKDWTKLYCVF